MAIWKGSRFFKMIESYRYREEIIFRHPEVASIHQKCEEIVRKIDAIFTDEPPAGVCKRFGDRRALDGEKYAEQWSRARSERCPQNADMVIGCRRNDDERLFVVELKKGVTSWDAFKYGGIVRQYEGTYSTLAGHLEIHSECIVIVNDDFYEERRRWARQRAAVIRARGDRPPHKTRVMTESEFFTTFFE